MPIFSITRRERRLPGAVNDTTSSSPNVSKPSASTARAPSVAYPSPQYSPARRQPLSTQRVKCASKGGGGQANEARERRDVGDLDRPQPEAVLLEVGLDTRS